MLFSSRYKPIFPRTREVAEPESEVFGWSRIFLPDSGSPVGHFLHHTPKMGIPVEMVQFLLKLLLNERFLAVQHISNFIPFMLRSRKFWKLGVGYFTSDSIPCARVERLLWHQTQLPLVIEQFRTVVIRFVFSRMFFSFTMT